MTTMPQDLRTLIASTTGVTQYVSTRIHYNRIPESSARSHIWFRVGSDNEELTLDGVGGIHEASVDLECVATTEGGAQNAGDAVKSLLHGYAGSMGNITCDGCFVEDKDDDYLPYSISDDSGAHVVAYGLRLFYTT